MSNGQDINYIDGISLKTELEKAKFIEMARNAVENERSRGTQSVAHITDSIHRIEFQAGNGHNITTELINQSVKDTKEDGYGGLSDKKIEWAQGFLHTILLETSKIPNEHIEIATSVENRSQSRGK